MFGTFFLGTLYLQNVRHYDALEIGLAFLPVTVCMGTLSVRYSEELITRSARGTSLAGLRADGGRARAVRAGAGRRDYLTQLLPTMALLGPGPAPASRRWSGWRCPASKLEQAGLASGLVNTTAPGRRRARPGRAGDAVDAPGPGSCSPSGTAPADALVGGYHLAFWIATGLIVVAVGIGLLVLQNPASAAELAEADAQPADAGDVDAEVDELVYQAA